MGQTESTESKEVIKTERKKSIRVAYKTFKDLNEEQKKFLLDHYEKHIDNELKKYNDKSINFFISTINIDKFIKKQFYPNDTYPDDIYTDWCSTNDTYIRWCSSNELEYKLIEIIQLKVKRPFTVIHNTTDSIGLNFIFFPINMYKKDN